MNILENIPLAKHTTLRIGGPAKFFVEAKNEKDILEALKFAREKNLPFFVLGGGSNILVSDKGFEGIVIKILNSQFSISNETIKCGAGCQLSAIVNESVKSGLTGLEWAAGIPRATVGGAVRGNAGAFGKEMADCVESVRALEIPNSLEVRPFSSESRAFGIPRGRTLKLQDCKLSYRDSIFKQNPNLIILSTTLKLQRSTSKRVKEKIEEILKKRKQKQPLEFPSAGSFFKNPVASDKNLIKQFELDTGLKIKENKIPAAYLIEEVGLKGKKVGGAIISPRHANFIINTGKATADNVLTLVAMAKTRVRDRFGIQLDEEVQFVGF